MATSERSSTPPPLTLSAEDSLVSRSAWPENAEAWKMIEISGRSCCASLKLSGLLGQFVKILTASCHWQPKMCVLRWRISVIKPFRLILRLVPSAYQAWNGIYGLFPRPTASDAKGSGKGRFRNSKTYRGNFREKIRENIDDGIYPNPEFVEWVKGFPDGWTDLNR